VNIVDTGAYLACLLGASVVKSDRQWRWDRRHRKRIDGRTKMLPIPLQYVGMYRLSAIRVANILVGRIGTDPSCSTYARRTSSVRVGRWRNTCPDMFPRVHT
jgi:hypothetical protein